MKRLWKTIPPCLSDTIGFESVINVTEGLGIIDDPSTYKPLRFKEGNQNPTFHDRGGFDPNASFAHKRQGHAHDHHRVNIRTLNSEIRNEDIIHGTEAKVLKTFEQGNELFHPDFVLLSHAPSSSMIGSDLDYCAEKITEISRIPAANVNLDGDKDYLTGISSTLKTMGKLLLKKEEPIPNTVNLLGCNVIDFSDEMIQSLENELTEAGFHVLSRWGSKETTANLKQASSASVNLVVNVSGLALARFMEQEFNIPYLICAPFGQKQMEYIVRSLQGQSAAAEEKPSSEKDLSILIIAEQLLANALRESLHSRGFTQIRTASFYDMDKVLMTDKDKKLNSEDDLAQLLAQNQIQAVFGDPDFKYVSEQAPTWIDLPNYGNQSPIDAPMRFDMTGKKLDEWLDKELAMKGMNL